MSKGRLINGQQGMTLIEIMIALLIGIFLIAGVIEIFIGSKQSYRMLDNLSRMQENGRFAMDFISHDIRKAGIRARVTGAAVCVLSDDLPVAISGTNDDTSDNNILDGTDTLTILTATQSCPITADTPITYSIRSGASGRPSLFKNENSLNELIEGVEDMQILYGEDIDADDTPDYYVPANQVVSMARVVSVRINLLVASAENNLSIASVDYRYNGSTVTPSAGDLRLRWQFSSTIALRNRLP